MAGNDEFWEVDEIIAHRLNGGRLQYQVKWKKRFFSLFPYQWSHLIRRIGEANGGWIIVFEPEWVYKEDMSCDDLVDTYNSIRALYGNN